MPGKLKFLVIVLTMILCGCQTELTTSPNNTSDLKIPTSEPNQQPVEVKLTSKYLNSPLPRQTVLLQSDQQLDNFVQANNEFALAIFQQLRNENTGQNMIFSPHSISFALAMTYAGAGGQTADEMRMVLGISQDDLSFHQNWNTLDQWLANRTKEIQANSPDYKLRLTNAVWAQQDYPFNSSYLDLLSTFYGSGLHTIDFSGLPEPSRLEINNWVAENTSQKIIELIPEGAIKPLTRMVLVNAIYLNAPWQQAFNSEFTTKQSFFKLDQQVVDVNMMEKTINLPYLVTDQVSMVEIPYIGDDLAMVLLMPESKSYDSFVSTLDESMISDLISQETWGEVELKIPRFKAENKFQLNNVLGKMGMKQAFDPNLADFSVMAEGNDLYIDQVIHQAVIAVDETGTEAAAATAVIILGKGFNPSEPQKITFDHPFLFFIRDTKSGSILFLGQILNPIDS
ncbi:MAG: serpin family protein [Anaerolineaceae bacterium]|nr:serpin family protein [Anaerolineaceae bacterium]